MRRIHIAAVAVALVATACAGSTSQPANQGTPTTAEQSDSELSQAGPLDIQGHRGARGLRPENTLPAFETALDLGVTTLELDLHLSSDDKIVVWHDPEVNSDKCGLRTGAPEDVPDPDAGASAGQERMIRSLTADQLAWYECNRNPDPGRFDAQVPDPTSLAGDSYSIVTLERLFEFVNAYAESDAKTASQRSGAETVSFNIETKRNPDEPDTIGDGFDGSTAGTFELEVLRLVEAFGLEDRVVIQSFDHRSLWAIRSENPSIKLAALTVDGPVDTRDLANRGASIWSPNQQAVTERTLKDAHDASLDVIPWTVNDPADMQRLIGLGVDGLITDRPDVLIALVTTE